MEEAPSPAGHAGDVPRRIYVRHAMAEAVAGVHPSQWHLGPEGSAAAEHLAARLDLPPTTLVITSPEPKAWETAMALAGSVRSEPRVDDRLVEVGRPWVGPGYRAVAHRYLRGECVEGWEADATVAARVTGAVGDAVAGEVPAAVVVVSHGLALAVALAATLGDGFDREAFWSRLTFPDAWELQADDDTLRRPHVAGGPGALSSRLADPTPDLA